MPTETGPYDEALERFHETGPEREGWLSNHGPMVAEALTRLGRGDQVHSWSDRYLARLEDVPRGIEPIRAEAWRDPLGDPLRTGDWITFFLQQVEQHPWQDLLVQWWPRLLPGIAAGATHGVIRVGHAVRALRVLETEPRRQELAHALAYWAARWQPIPVVHSTGERDASAAVAAVPQVVQQEFGIRSRIAQLPDTAGWAGAVASLSPPAADSAVPDALDELVDAVLAHYASHAHGNPTMLVHAATAPNAVAQTLPSLPQSLWRQSFETAWSATAAVLAAYSPTDKRAMPAPGTSADVLERALQHAGEHVIKLADTALLAHERSSDPRALSAVAAAIELDA